MRLSGDASPKLRAENAELRRELAGLRQQLATAGPAAVHDRPTGAAEDVAWPAEIDYARQTARAAPTLAQLAGMSEQLLAAGAVRDSSDFDYLPLPTADEAQLEADFVRWGYCIVDGDTPPHTPALKSP